MDNALIYDVLKESFSTVTAKSDAHVGGPVYGIGGRSTVWGLYTPMISNTQFRGWPDSVRKSLQQRDYNRAYRVMTNDREANISTPYPHESYFPGKSGSDLPIERSSLKRILNNLREQKENYEIINDFDLCPMAAEFTARYPSRRTYQILMGGYSTVNWILDRVYNQTEHFHLLCNTRVVAVNKRVITDRETRAESLTVIDERGKERTFSTGRATIILSAGTVDTALIALRSGLNENSPIGQGLSDHDIWGVRFISRARSLQGFANRALRLQTMVKLRPAESMSCQDSGGAADCTSCDADDCHRCGDAGRQSRCHKCVDDDKHMESCLLNLTINAPAFLGRASEVFPGECINYKGEVVSEQKYVETFSEENDECQKRTEKPLAEVVIQVVYCLSSRLVDENRVLNMPKPVPVIRVSKWDTSIFADSMQHLAQDIMNELMREETPYNPKDSKANWLSTLPQVARVPFGVVAHEVGTMRIGKTVANSVVDENLRVHRYQNLFVCDLSVFPTSPSANPCLTLAALAQRLGKHLETLRQRPTSPPEGNTSSCSG